MISLHNNKKRCKARQGADADSSVTINACRVKEDGPSAAGPSVSNATGCKKKREKKSAVKAAVVPGPGNTGRSPTNNLKEALFLEMLEDSSDSPSFTERNKTMQ